MRGHQQIEVVGRETTPRSATIPLRETTVHIMGTYRLDAPRQRVGEHLQSVDAIAGCIPVRRELQDLGEDSYRATVRAGIGPVSGAASGRFQITERREPAKMRVRGHDGGGPFKAHGGMLIRLEEEAGRTVVTYKGKVQLTGRMRLLDDRIVNLVARTMITRFFKRMQRSLAEGIGACARNGAA
jgi:carbon monoxide dehydrogenase subunit G